MSVWEAPYLGRAPFRYVYGRGLNFQKQANKLRLSSIKKHVKPAEPAEMLVLTAAPAPDLFCNASTRSRSDSLCGGARTHAYIHTCCTCILCVYLICSPLCLVAEHGVDINQAKACTYVCIHIYIHISHMRLSARAHECTNTHTHIHTHTKTAFSTPYLVSQSKLIGIPTSTSLVPSLRQRNLSQRKPCGAGKGNNLPQKPRNRSSQIIPHPPPGCDSAFSPTCKNSVAHMYLVLAFSGFEVQGLGVGVEFRV